MLPPQKKKKKAGFEFHNFFFTHTTLALSILPTPPTSAVCRCCLLHDSTLKLMEVTHSKSSNSDKERVYFLHISRQSTKTKHVTPFFFLTNDLGIHSISFSSKYIQYSKVVRNGRNGMRFWRSRFYCLIVRKNDLFKEYFPSIIIL